MVLPLAHAGHILIDGPLYGGPVIVVMAGLWLFARMEKARGEAEDEL
jgi:hypothetical protein